MTLTSLLPTLRHSIPSPFDRDAWPVGARPTLDDVVVSGVSLLRLVELCATPCVHTAPRVIPMSGGVASPTLSASVVIASVVSIGAEGVRVDASFDSCHPAWGECRLIGRISSAREARIGVCGPQSPAPAGDVLLPDDLRVGDLIAVPCSDYLALGDVRPNCGR